MSMRTPRLLAGSSGRERAPAEKRAATSDRWFEPLHVQDPAAARERIAAQVAAGADIVVAPTWRTHRRALMAVGESRRALEWTRAAVDVARDGVDAGLERRTDAGLERRTADPTGDEADTSPPPIAREAPLVAGVVPLLDDEPEPGSGHLLPQEAAAARDFDELAGHLADAEVDLVLVETRIADRGSRVAVEAATGTGLTVWVAAVGTTDEDKLTTWAETSVAAGAVGLLFGDGSGAVAARLAEGVTVETWGGLVGEVGDRSEHGLRGAAERWLAEDAGVIGLLRGARPGLVAAMRSSIDARIRADLTMVRARTERWDAAVSEAAAMAPGGQALWLSPAPPDARALPGGFTWTSAPPSEVGRLPDARFRLVAVVPGSDLDVSAVAGALESGGIVVVAHVRAAAGVEGLRPLVIDDRADPPLAIFRREA
jgi:hypothetical protein